MRRRNDFVCFCASSPSFRAFFAVQNTHFMRVHTTLPQADADALEKKKLDDAAKAKVGKRREMKRK